MLYSKTCLKRSLKKWPNEKKVNKQRLLDTPAQ